MLAVEYQSRVLEVLDWGSRVWKDIPTSDRGCVFERSFIRGIRRLHVMAIHGVGLQSALIPAFELLPFSFWPGKSKTVPILKKSWQNYVTNSLQKRTHTHPALSINLILVFPCLSGSIQRQKHSRT